MKELPEIEEFAQVLGDEVDVAGLKRAIEAPQQAELEIDEAEEIDPDAAAADPEDAPAPDAALAPTPDGAEQVPATEAPEARPPAEPDDLK